MLPGAKALADTTSLSPSSALDIAPGDRRSRVQAEHQFTTAVDLREADEIFSSGNYSKVVPVGRIDNRQLQPGPLYRKARELYMDFASSKSA